MKNVLELPFLLLLSCSLLLSAQTEIDDWYPFLPENDITTTGGVGLQDWNIEPAGVHGRIERRGDKLFYNGEKFKLWGTNLGFKNSCPSKGDAEKTAVFYRKYGLNALRHHKHLDGPGWAGFQSERSFVEFDLEKLDRFDYFNKQLKDNGIYIKHSPTFHVKFGRDDVHRIPFWQEIGEFKNDRPDARIKAGGGWIFLAKEIQDLQIEQTVKILNHVNPYTGLRYADDPALFCVELSNEDAVLFFSTIWKIQQSPTIRKRLAPDFSAFLKQKYGSEAVWRAAWGEDQIVQNLQDKKGSHLGNMIGVDEVKGEVPAESIDQGTVVPWFGTWFADASLKPGSEQEPLQRRLLDTAAYLIGLQHDFYTRFIAEVRKTGFDGEIITSNWQAGSLVGHLLNLKSDSITGMVDRHNYFAGGGFGGFKVGKKFQSHSLLSRPGGGNLTVGFQQVDGAAFMLSEWTHEQPNEWYAEGPVTMGAYGFGLQGWDVSYHFLFELGYTISDRLGRGTWDGRNPAILTTFPVVSRMVRRGDVQEGKTFPLNAHVPSLLDGKMSFRGETVQNRDQKLFSTDKAPPEALAADRIAVRFTENYEETPDFPLEKYLEGDTVVSSTGELRWTRGIPGEPNSGYFTIATQASKGFVGFAPGGKTFDLGDGWTVTPEKGFAVILITAKGPEENLSNAKEILISATARCRNTGMTLNEEGNTITAKGKPPILMEPVQARISMPIKGELNLLNHDGAASVATRQVDGQLALNGVSDRTPYYVLIRD